MNENPPPYVSSTAPGLWLLEGAEHLRAQLAELPVKVSSVENQLMLNYPTSAGDNFAGSLASSLRQLGFAFSYGRDWAPSAYLQYLRDHQALSGPFTEISWTAPGKWRLQTV